MADFTPYLSCTRASTGYAQTVAGTLTSFATNTLRRTDKGLLIEEARTNVVLHCRDLTNAAWTKTNITAAKDQTGPDGVANSASKITATAGNGTCLQAITLASSARFQSCYIKRVTGSGVINKTMDNGSTWTAVTVTAGWTRVPIPTQTLANPTVGFRIVTSGDEVAIDFVQNEDSGSFATSPIETTTAAVTRAADAVTLIGTADTLTDAATGTAIVSADVFPIGAGHILSSADPAILYLASDTVLRSWTGAVDLTKGGLASVLTTATKFGNAWSPAGRSLTGQGLSAVTDASVKSTPAAWALGSSGVSVFVNTYIRQLKLWNTRLSDADLVTETA